MSTLMADPLPASQVADPERLARLMQGIHLEPRCRICRRDAIREKVNGLLGSGATYKAVLRAVDEDNAKLDKRDRVTISSIRNHTQRHFPVQNVARATYREILERQAKENGVDFVEGVATAITPMAFYETVMVRGYQTLVDPGTKVDVSTGMIAAGRLQAMIDSHAGQPDWADIRGQVNRVIAAIKSTVPEAMWGEIVSKLDGTVEAVEPLEEDETEIFDPDDDPFDDDLDELDD